MGRDWDGGVCGRQGQMERHGCQITHVKLETTKEKEDSCLHTQGRSRLIWDRNRSYRADGCMSHRWLHLQGLLSWTYCLFWAMFPLDQFWLATLIPHKPFPHLLYITNSSKTFTTTYHNTWYCEPRRPQYEKLKYISYMHSTIK